MHRHILIIWLLVLGVFNRIGAQERLTYEHFGTVTVYRNSPQPSEVVLFISGDGGWNLGVIDMAQALAKLDALVAGIDITHYLPALQNSSEQCLYPASDLEMLSKFIQQHYGYPDYVNPILVGYSSGATLVYVTLVQAPATTFKGAISLGFCPDLPLTKPLCKGSGLEYITGPKGEGYSFLPASNLEVPWIALQGNVDQVCSHNNTRHFVQQVKNGQIIELPNVGHGFSVQKNWMPRFKAAYKRIIDAPPVTPSAPQAGDISDLPLSEVPVSGGKNSDWLAVHITGDGDYGVTDKGISEELGQNGIPVAALNSLKYFWKARTPQETATDVERIIRHYLTVWNKSKVIIIGYSFGADVLPFVLTRLPADFKYKIELVTFLGLSSTAEFEFHLTDWVGETGKNVLPVKPELEKLKGMNMLCFYGAEDSDALCKTLPPGLVKSIVLKGGHRIGSNYQEIVKSILALANGM